MSILCFCDTISFDTSSSRSAQPTVLRRDAIQIVYRSPTASCVRPATTKLPILFDLSQPHSTTDAITSRPAPAVACRSRHTGQQEIVLRQRGAIPTPPQRNKHAKRCATPRRVDTGLMLAPFVCTDPLRCSLVRVPGTRPCILQHTSPCPRQGHCEFPKGHGRLSTTPRGGLCWAVASGRK